MFPRDELFGQGQTSSISACEHYAGSERMIEKALALQAEKDGRFDVTIDLEDGAPAGQEAEHAKLAFEILARPRPYRVGVRIHGPTDPHWQADLRAVMPSRPAYLVIPKVSSVAEVISVASFVAGLGPSPPLHVLIETHGALRDAFAIATLPEVESLDFGLMDFVSDHGGAIGAQNMRSPGQFDHALIRRAKAEISAAAHAHRKVPTHNVTLDVRDPKQAEDDARRAYRELGYLRMWSVHPIQIEAILKGMAPGEDEVAIAIEILSAAKAKAWAPIEHGGRLHDRGSYRYYWTVLERAERAGTKLPSNLRG